MPGFASSLGGGGGASSSSSMGGRSSSSGDATSTESPSSSSSSSSSDSTILRFFLLTTGLGAGFFFLLEDVFLLEPKSAAWPFFFEPNPIGRADDFFRRASAASRSAFAAASAFAAFSPVGSAQSVRSEIRTSQRILAVLASRNATPASESSSSRRAASAASLRQSSGQASFVGATAYNGAVLSFWRRTSRIVRPAMDVPSFDFVRSGVTTTTARWQSGCAFSNWSRAVCASEAGQALRSCDVLTPSLLDQRAAATASAVGGALTDDWPKGMVFFARFFVRAAVAPLDGPGAVFAARGGRSGLVSDCAQQYYSQ
mmetsp:Transcript_13334/g.35419  ORF Transcript_13334/g.35419 Transcript_13334/m.35419 type:complete len:314 (+) Transcript_13334:242-1183(+)